MDTEKEAERIIEMFFLHEEQDVMLNGTHYKKAIQCALLHVEGIIKEYEDNICECGYDYDFDMWRDKQSYWLKVKQIILNK